jgi:hypothetical protein
MKANPSNRTNSTEKSKDNLHEIFSSDGITLPRGVIRLCNKFPVIYDAHGKCFYLTDARGIWIPVSDASVSKHVSDRLGISLDSARAYHSLIQRYLTVDIALPLAGYRSGVHSFDGTPHPGDTVAGVY